MYSKLGFILIPIWALVTFFHHRRRKPHGLVTQIFHHRGHRAHRENTALRLRLMALDLKRRLLSMRFKQCRKQMLDERVSHGFGPTQLIGCVKHGHKVSEKVVTAGIVGSDLLVVNCGFFITAVFEKIIGAVGCRMGLKRPRFPVRSLTTVMCYSLNGYPKTNRHSLRFHMRPRKCCP